MRSVHSAARPSGAKRPPCPSQRARGTRAAAPAGKQAAPLARALYFTTEVNHQVPEDLYYAVAQVIAYVFNLASIRPGVAPVQRPQTTVPPNMQFDADGRLETEETVN
jgi:hypothetical protein